MSKTTLLTLLLAVIAAAFGNKSSNAAMFLQVAIEASEDTWIKSTEPNSSFYDDDRTVIWQAEGGECRSGFVRFHLDKEALSSQGTMLTRAKLSMQVKHKTATSIIALHALSSSVLPPTLELLSWHNAPWLLPQHVVDVTQLQPKSESAQWDVTETVEEFLQESSSASSELAFGLSSNNHRWTEFYTIEAAAAEGDGGRVSPPTLELEFTPLSSVSTTRSERMLSTRVADRDSHVKTRTLKNHGRKSNLLVDSRRTIFLSFPGTVDAPPLGGNGLSSTVTTVESATLELHVMRVNLKNSVHQDQQQDKPPTGLLVYDLGDWTFSEREITGRIAPPLETTAVSSTTSMMVREALVGTTVQWDVTEFVRQKLRTRINLAIAPTDSNIRVSFASRDARRHAPPQLRIWTHDKDDGERGETSAQPFVSFCLSRSRVETKVVVLDGPQYQQEGGTPPRDAVVYDASQATWPGSDPDGDPLHWPIVMRYRPKKGRGNGSCWYGGSVQGLWDETAPDVTWEDPYHHAGGFTVLGTPNFLLEGLHIHNQGDGLHLYAPGIRVRGVWLQDIHDDCIENDDMHNLVVEDSFMDGCYMALSARANSDDDGSINGRQDNVWTVRDSLIRMEAQPTVAKPEHWEATGHQDFFKWDYEGRSPRLALHNNVFRADKHSIHGTLGLPEPLVLDSCSNNVMVWLGLGPFRGYLPGGGCFLLTTDESVWNDAVARWKRRHGRGE